MNLTQHNTTCLAMRLIEAHSLSQPDFASQCVCARASRQSFGQSSASAVVQTVSERSQDFTPGKKKLKNILVFLTANTPGAASGQICIHVFREERSEASAETLAKHNQPFEAHCFKENKTPL